MLPGHQLVRPDADVLIAEIGLGDQRIFALPVRGLDEVLRQWEELTMLEPIGIRVSLLVGRNRGQGIDGDDVVDQPQSRLIAIGDQRILADLR